MSRRHLIVAGLAAATAAVAVPTIAQAEPPNEPSDHASCAGTLSVFNQAHPEFFGSRSDIAHEFIEEATAEGIPPGEIYTFFAEAHGGVEHCTSI
jgi:hypothetical protein